MNRRCLPLTLIPAFLVALSATPAPAEEVIEAWRSPFGLAASISANPRPPLQPAANSVLILYDNSGEYGWVGGIHARLLANLLGHFPVPCQAKPIEERQ